MTREIALDLTRKAEQWAASYASGECLLWQAQWALNRSNAAWDELQRDTP